MYETDVMTKTTESPLSRRAVIAGALAVPTAAAFGIATATPALSYAWTRELRQGDSGDDVRELQVRVAGWAADSASQSHVGIDGQFGPITAAAVRRFQSGYGIAANGVVSAQTQERLNWLEGSGNQTRHFADSEFTSRDGAGFTGGRVGEAQVRQNVRRLMWKLEALRRKLGDNPISVNSGFRSVAHNNSIPGAASNSMHMYGVAADVSVANRTPTQVYNQMKTCGFSGIILYTGHSHGDSRAEHNYGSSGWYWSEG